MNIKINIHGIGISGLGIESWHDFCKRLGVGSDGANSEKQDADASILTARQRRRMPETAKLAITAAEQACAMAGIANNEPAVVFASNMGDIAIADYICRILTESPTELSPTQFHNSVHNAASGYWSITADSTQNVNAICAGEDSLNALFIEATSLAISTGKPVLTCVYEAEAVAPLSDIFQNRQSFCVAILLSVNHEIKTIASLQVSPANNSVSALDFPDEIQSLMEKNSTTQLFPLLALIAGYTNNYITISSHRGPAVCFRKIS